MPAVSSSDKVLSYEKVAESVKRAQYAVRGEIYLAASERIKKGEKVIFTNVGNPHGLGQKPLTFPRQVMALLTAPFLLDDPRTATMFPADAITRAKTYLANIKGGVGAYSDSVGNPYIRDEVAQFIQARDGHAADPERIFLTNGASEAVRTLLRTLIRGHMDGVMVPVPQYPLYSASIALYDGCFVGYELDESTGWGLDLVKTKASLDAARARGLCVRGLVFINPGNPTGQCLSRADVEALVRFCFDNRLVLMADEVYQENVYRSRHPFTSAKKVMCELGEPYTSGLELVSFHTVSKGVYGECGLRGGYMEMCNFDPRTVEEIYKICSINLSPNVPGQVAVGLMCNPPRRGDPSFDSFMAEKAELLASLKRRARLLTDAFNSLEGVSCQETEGALYSFPQITLPPAAVAAARAAGKAPDVFYCLALLSETGLSTVPGSGFGQAEGTFHFRTTILPAEADMGEVVELFKRFHKGFVQRYSGPVAKL
ncbi:nicotinanamine aminotransferase A [Tribonema minus]|uniref:Nicotinanamine aminotransferase A n=1 Tax=Tribonema minus TaxID=303371 RepID=A0A835Z6X1_9STRA|nr:nicotinanamine aminotransferase A [Tribonema minus]